MFSWRMLVTTGEAKYADLIERTLYNGFLAGTSLDGQRYIYANPLHVREGHGWREDDADYRRVAWFHCACCPPNAMRLLASLEYYVVLGRARSVIVHQYIPGSYTVGLDEEEATVSIDTGYPWSGQVAVRIDDTPDSNWELSLRIPEWALEWSLTVNGAPSPVAAEGGWVTLGRAWRPGDTVVLSLALAPRLTAPGPRMDAVRGAVALECGPLVYCVESADNDGVDLDQVAISLMEALQTEPADARLAGARAIRLEAVSGRAAQDNWWPYRPVGSRSDPPAVPVTLTAIPYFAWGNREQGAMRVWLPRLGR